MVILKGLKNRLDESPGSWADEVWLVLWFYRTTVQSTTKKTPFIHTYGEEAVIPVKVGEPSPRMLLGTLKTHESMDLINEVTNAANLAKQALKQRVDKIYHTKVRPRSFQVRDLVLRQSNAGTLGTRGKLAFTWKGPFRIKEVLEKGAYKLETLDGSDVSRSWNVTHLKKYYS
ncbi:uncharacterized protein [Arachis hypogaea]|uniref:uncharacterized protein n=1 Tax=Arachis hypogaea TaxID=3818 RepID=UPI003B20EA06